MCWLPTGRCGNPSVARNGEQVLAVLVAVVPSRGGSTEMTRERVPSIWWTCEWYQDRPSGQLGATWVKVWDRCDE